MKTDLGNFGPQIRVLAGVLQEVDKLYDLCLCLIHTSHICKPHTSLTRIPDYCCTCATHVGLRMGGCDVKTDTRNSIGIYSWMDGYTIT